MWNRGGMEFMSVGVREGEWLVVCIGEKGIESEEWKVML